LFAVATLERLDPTSETYPLDVLSLIEAILENPTVILRKQLDRLKGEAVAEMKAAGVEYDERMAELDKLDYPKPNAEMIYQTFNAFALEHPWVGEENIRPKGVARDMYESAQDFRNFVRDYDLETSEGSVLRYLTDVYKAMVQTVPARARTHEVEDLIDYLGGVVRGVDASLIEEWEVLRDPSYVPARLEQEPEVVSRGVTSDARAFTVMVRNAVFRVVQQLARHDFEAAAASVEAAPDAEPWTGARIAALMSPYFEEHATLRTDPRARGTRHSEIRAEPIHWRVRQILVDPDEHADWYMALRVDVARSDDEARPVLILESIGR
jgi:hypothetical protein